MSLFALFWHPLFAFPCNCCHASPDSDQFWRRPIISKLPFIYDKWWKPEDSNFESGPRSSSCDSFKTPDYWENFSDLLYNPCRRGFNGRPLMLVSGRFIVVWWPTMLITGSRVNVCLGLQLRVGNAAARARRWIKISGHSKHIHSHARVWISESAENYPSLSLSLSLHARACCLRPSMHVSVSDNIHNRYVKQKDTQLIQHTTKMMSPELTGKTS